MKTKSTQILILRIILFILLCLYSFLVFGQTGSDTVSNLNKFSGIITAEKTKLQWSLKTGNNVSTVVIEKGHTENTFQACAEFWVNFEGNNETNFQFADKKTNEDTIYYRLKIIDAIGKVQYSNTLQFTSYKSEGKQ